MNTDSNVFGLPRYEEYIDCFVAFVDILGFDSRARGIQSEEDFSKIGALLSSLKAVTVHINNKNGDLINLKAMSVSDSIIFSMPFHDPFPSGISIALFLHMLQYQLLKGHQTLLRGYMTRGPVYHKDNIIFGKGYSEAYQNEKEIGHAPRIIINSSLIEEIKGIDLANQFPYGHIFDIVCQDRCDGKYFIDYLKPLKMLNNIDEMKAERERIKEIVRSSLNEYRDNLKIIRKYNWLSNYISLTDNYYEE
jgi:hypothetical protein